MPEDKSAVEDFLGGLNKQEKDPFKSSDPFAQMTEEKQEEGTEEKEEEEAAVLPFHKDPKVQKYVQKQIDKALEAIKPQGEAQRFSEDARAGTEQDEITAVLERVIGNDTPEKVAAVKDMRRVMGSLEERGAQRALAQLEEQAGQQAQEDQAAVDELDASFEEVEEAYGVDLSSSTPKAQKTRSDFIDYIRKIAPKNEEGEVTSFPDIPAAWEEFQDKSKRVSPTTNRAKELASRSLSSSTDATVAPKVTGKSWKDIDKIFNNLSS